jgi:parvulin-like peptidyl-prolyl isomerase
VRRLALLAIVCASCTKAPPPAGSPFDDPQVLAVVGQEKITRADFGRAAANRPIASGALLDELIEQRALVQTARERGYDRDPQHLAAVERLLANRVREEHRESQKLEVTDAEIEAKYRAEPAKHTVPAKIRVAMIFVEASATFAAEKRAERLAAIEKARAEAVAEPTRFGALAAEYSYDQATKFRGGDIGYLIEGVGAEELEAPVVVAAFALKKPGDLSEIVATARGFYLLRLTENTEAAVRPLTSVAPQIRADLLREKREHSEKALANSLTAHRRIEVRRDRLPQPRIPAGTPAPSSPPTGPTSR